VADLKVRREFLGLYGLIDGKKKAGGKRPAPGAGWCVSSRETPSGAVDVVAENKAD